MSTRKKIGRFLVGLVLLGLIPGLVLAAPKSRVTKVGEFNPNDKTVDMFEAIEQGEINVTLIPKDSTECNVLIENKGDKPLNVKLPDAFAGVPVLAQGGFGGGMGGGGFGGGGGGQSVGGGMGGGGMGGGGMGGGGGFFNVPAEKVGQMKVTTMCLEHGKPEPRPKMKYQIKPIAEFTDKAEVHELCRMLGTGKLPQRAAQVAAWHFCDGMSWHELAAKRLEFANGTSRPYFSQQELQAGMQIAFTAARLAEQRKQQGSKSDSLSQR